MTLYGTRATASLLPILLIAATTNLMAPGALALTAPPGGQVPQRYNPSGAVIELPRLTVAPGQTVKIPVMIKTPDGLGTVLLRIQHPAGITFGAPARGSALDPKADFQVQYDARKRILTLAAAWGAAQPPSGIVAVIPVTAAASLSGKTVTLSLIELVLADPDDRIYRSVEVHDGLLRVSGKGMPPPSLVTPARLDIGGGDLTPNASLTLPVTVIAPKGLSHSRVELRLPDGYRFGNPTPAADRASRFTYKLNPEGTSLIVDQRADPAVTGKALLFRVAVSGPATTARRVIVKPVSVALTDAEGNRYPQVHIRPGVITVAP